MAALLAATAVSPVIAHTPDSHGAPRPMPVMLVVVPDAEGYVIRARASDPTETQDRGIAFLPLGSSLKLDRDLFVAATPPAKEAPDASRR